MNILITYENTINTFLSELELINEEVMSNKPIPHKWSKKEILGHLCDSVTINHIRFLNILRLDHPIRIEGYEQDYWVKIHDYQTNYSKQEIASLFKQLSRRIEVLLKIITEEQYNKECIVNGDYVSFKWLVEDYIYHMKHHIHQIRGNR